MGQALMVQQLSAPGVRSWPIVGSSLAWLSPLSFAAPRLPSSAAALTFLPGKLLLCCSLCFQAFPKPQVHFKTQIKSHPDRAQRLAWSLSSAGRTVSFLEPR